MAGGFSMIVVMISQETFKEFQTAVKEIYGVVLSDKEAVEYVTTLASYFDLLAKIDSRRQIQISEPVSNVSM